MNDNFDNGLVSIVMPLFNAEQYISEAIESVLQQTYAKWELLIVDDCSTDKGPEMVAAYCAKDGRIKLIKNIQNLGPAKSRNLAIEHSSGQYIAFLDSDDLWHSEKLSVQIAFMQDNEIPFSYTFYQLRNEQNEIIKTLDNLPLRVNYDSTLKFNRIGCLTVIFDVAYFGKVYMADIRKRQDYTLWLKLLKLVDFAYCLDIVLATYTVRANSISRNKFRLLKHQWNVYRNIEKLSMMKSMYYVITHIYSKLFVY